MRLLRLSGVSFAFFFLLTTSTIDLQAAPGQQAPTLDQAAQAAHDADAPSRVIVRYRAGSEPQVRARMEKRRQRIVSSLRGIGAITVNANRGELRKIAKDPDVVGVSTDASIRSHGATLSDLFSATLDAQQLRRTLGLSAWPEGGSGVGVAIVDSGIAPVPDLAGRITAFYDFTAGGVPAWPSDRHGHGTHLAGLIAGSGLASAGQYAGVAPAVRLIGLKVLDADGHGYTSDVIAAIEFAINNRTTLGIDIINLSLGHPVLEAAATDPLVQVVERATAAGIVVVASAGNTGKSSRGDVGFGGINSPGNAPSALTVGAVNTRHTADRLDDEVSSFSSRGPTWYDGLIKPDVLAPGSALTAATDPSSSLGKRPELRAGWTPYITLSGTSMSAAVTTGVVALMIEANRKDNPNTRLAPNTVKMLLQYSATATPGDHGSAAGVLTEGAGTINAAGAIELARAINPSATVETPWLERGISTGTALGGTWLPWTRRVTWGDRLVAGDVITRKERGWRTSTRWGAAVGWSSATWLTESVVIETFGYWSSRPLWSSASVTTLDGDDHIVWGNSMDDHIVWGNSMDDGDHIVWGNTTIGARKQ
jgi:serine protease AprX